MQTFSPRLNPAATSDGGFAAGTLILAQTGPVFIEDLCSGDLVLTRDHGPQPLRGLERSLSDSRAITIAPEAIGPGLPWRHLRLSHNQRILLSGWKAALLFGPDETLVPVGDLVSDGTILASPVIGATPTYQPVFDRPEIIWAEGIEVEVAAKRARRSMQIVIGGLTAPVEKRHP
ncbi:MAG: Hint domain-containing protein [Paracoccaceae bacterium]